MQPYFTGKWKARYNSLIAGGMDISAAAERIFGEQQEESLRKQVKNLEDDNKALRSTIKQLVLYGAK